MNGLLGTLAGGGMLVFIGVLVLLALRRAGLVTSAGTARDLLWCAGVTLAVGALYFLSGLLLHFAVFQELPEAGDYTGIFRSGYLSRVYDALEKPSFFGPLTGLFVYLGHAAGKLMFSQYHAGGLAAAWGMTLAASCLFYFRLQGSCGRTAARDAVFFLLALPCGVFFFLPGWGPVLFLIAALLFFFAGKRLCFGKPANRRGAYWAFLGVSGILSAFLTSLLALGRIA